MENAKQMKRFLLLALLAIVSVCIFSSCGDKDAGEDTSLKLSRLDNWKEYTIVYPSSYDKNQMLPVAEFASEIESVCCTRLRAESDFTLPGESAPTDTLEILIGLTNRQESADKAPTLAEDEFTVQLVGGRLVILGGSYMATVAALDFAKTELLTEEGIFYPTDNDFMKKAEFHSISICGTDISDFEIVYKDKDAIFGEQLASDLNELIAKKVYLTLPHCKMSEWAGGSAIFFEKSEELGSSNYKIYEKDGNLYISYDCAANAYNAIKLLRSVFDSDVKLEFASGYCKAESTPTYKILMFGASNTQMGYIVMGVDMYLQTQYGDISYEVINMGRSGGSVASAQRDFGGQFKTRAEREIYDLNPDAVILQFFFNGIGTAGVTTNSQSLTIERIWDSSARKEFDVNLLYENGEFIGVEQTKAKYPGIFTQQGRINFSSVKYDSLDEFNAAYADVERLAFVKHAVDATFPVDLENQAANITEFSKSMYSYYHFVCELASKGITVFPTTPINYDEEWEHTTLGERIIGIKYVHDDTTEFLKNAFADMDRVEVIDFSAPSLELKYQLHEESNFTKSYTNDRKHFTGMNTAACGIATTTMVDMLGKNIIFGKDETVGKDYVAYSEISTDGKVKADNSDVTDVKIEDGVLSFSYKPHGVSIASFEGLMEARQKLSNGKFEEGIEKYGENVNKEIIKVTGLDDGKTYTISMDGAKLKQTFTGAELAAGVDISLDKNNPSAQVVKKILEALETKRANATKIRGLGYVRETQLFKRGIDDSVATREELMKVLDDILAEFPDKNNYTHKTALNYKEMYDTLHEYYARVDLNDYKVKKLLDFDPYKVVIEELK
jgi:hypothetical protein